MKFARINRNFAGNRILMNVIPMVREVLMVTNPMIGESALPHFGLSPDKSAERMRVSALD